MATVVHNNRTGRYELIDHGRVVSTHTSASSAKEAGKRYGRKHSQPVSYQGPRMSSAEWIYSPSSDQGRGRSGGQRQRGFLGLF